MQPLQRLAERLHQARSPPTCGCPAAPAAAARRLELQALGQRPGIELVHPVESLDQRMPDVGAGRPAEALVRAGSNGSSAMT